MDPDICMSSTSKYLLVIDLFEDSLRNDSGISMIQGTIGLEGQVFNFSIISAGDWCAWQLKPEYVKAVSNNPKLFIRRRNIASEGLLMQPDQRNIQADS
jgi:hypothetical protein